MRWEIIRKAIDKPRSEEAAKMTNSADIIAL